MEEGINDHAEMQNSIVKLRRNFRRNFHKVGEIFEDFGCFSINATCGTNMIFQPFIHYHNITNSKWHEKCVHRCSCINDKYMEKNKQCVEKMARTVSSPKKVNILRKKIENYFSFLKEMKAIK